MSKGHYYNEFDPRAAAWLRELMKAGEIPQGTVDETPIQEVDAANLAGYGQHHFFTGISGWPRALKLAGWPESRHVLTGSPPCQPFSAAGKGKGKDDPRDLWGHFYRLIRDLEPRIVFFEQVEAAIKKHGWLDRVHSDLARCGYTVWQAVLPACSVGAPHIRHRLFGAAHAQCSQRGANGQCDAETSRRQQETTELRGSGQHGFVAEDGGIGGLDNTRPSGQSPPECGDLREPGRREEGRAVAESGESPGFWSDYLIIPCRDGKYRRIPASADPAGSPESGILTLVDGLPEHLAQVWLDCAGGFPLTKAKVPGRVGLLRGAGNSIVPQVAAEFIRAYMETEENFKAA